MDAPAISWRPLGQLFIEKGLLTKTRLEHALAEQAATGGRLGEKLVQLGYVSSSSLAQLLAEQYGVEISYDTGFGTGLRAELERRHESKSRPEPVEPEIQPILKLADPIDDGNGSDPLAPLAGLEEQWARLAAAEARVAEMESELESMREKYEHAAQEIETPKQRARSSNGNKSRS
jgi:hypothetical protein